MPPRWCAFSHLACRLLPVAGAVPPQAWRRTQHTQGRSQSSGRNLKGSAFQKRFSSVPALSQALASHCRLPDQTTSQRSFDPGHSTAAVPTAEDSRISVRFTSSAQRCIAIDANASLVMFGQIRVLSSVNILSSGSATSLFDISGVMAPNVSARSVNRPLRFTVMVKLFCDGITYGLLWHLQWTRAPSTRIDLSITTKLGSQLLNTGPPTLHAGQVAKSPSTATLVPWCVIVSPVPISTPPELVLFPFNSADRISDIPDIRSVSLLSAVF